MTTQSKEVEKWVDIEGFEGYYQVSNMARVRALTRTVKGGNQWGKSNHNLIGKIRLGSINKGGYRRVNLYKSGINKTITIHRLVAKAFISNPENYNAINHIDGVKLNNLPENLEWCSYSHNTKHALKLGLMKGMKGEKHPGSRLKKEDVFRIRELSALGNSFGKISKEYKISPSQVSRIILKKQWKHI